MADLERLAANSADLAAHFKGRAPVIASAPVMAPATACSWTPSRRPALSAPYFPVDASQAMLEMACAGAEDDDIETVGIKANVSSPVHLVYAADAAEPPRLFILSGNTMGSFDPLAEIRYVAQCLKPEDRLIVDGEISRPPAVRRPPRQSGGAEISLHPAGECGHFGRRWRNPAVLEAR